MAWFQVRPEFFIASLNSKPGTDAGLRRPRCRRATGRCRSCPARPSGTPCTPRTRPARSPRRWSARPRRSAVGVGVALGGVGRRRARRGGRGRGRGGRRGVGRRRACRTATGSSASSAPPPQAASARGRGRARRRTRSELHRRLPLQDGSTDFRASYRRIERAKRPKDRHLWPPRRTCARNCAAAGRHCFHLQPAAPIRAGFMFDESPSTWRGELAATLRLAGPLALANLLQMLVYAIDVIFVARLGEQRAGRLEPVDRAVRADDVVLLGPDRDGRRADRRRARPPPPRGARGPPQRAHGAVAGGRCAASSAWRCAGSGARSCSLTGQEPHIAELAGGFLRVIMWAMIPMIVANVLRSVVSALGRPVYATAITALAIGVSALGQLRVRVRQSRRAGAGPRGLGAGERGHRRVRLRCPMSSRSRPTGGCGATACSATGGAPNGSASASWSRTGAAGRGDDPRRGRRCSAARRS